MSDSMQAITQPVRSRRRAWCRVVLTMTAAAMVSFSPLTLAVSPAPDGGYANSNTAEGNEALFSADLSFGAADSDTAIGARALYSNTTGRYNTAVGPNALYSVTTGTNNTGIGAYALEANTAFGNTAVGSQALSRTTTGGENVAVGVYALNENTTGEENTASGTRVLFSNKTGSANTAQGANALHANVSGSANTATGADALYNNSANFNTADGWQALKANTSGDLNTGTGTRALYLNTKGSNNAAHGAQALLVNTIGNGNTADGVNALAQNTQGNRNTAAGAEALKGNTTGDNNVAIGFQAGSNLTVGNNNIEIGAPGVAGEANTIRVGKAGTQTRAFIQGIYGSPVSGGQQVFVTSAGKLGVVTPSSARFKEEVKPMEKSSEAILALQPVTFRYKPELKADEIPQFGLVAEEVEKIAPELVVRNEEGKVDGVRYEAVNAMLLNEFLKEHRAAQTEREKVAQLEAANAQQQKQIDALTAGLQKVSARVELSASQPALAENGSN